MSTLERTPVNFPRMKVRGRRRRELLARRTRYVRLYPYVAYQVQPSDVGNVVVMEVLAAPKEDSFSLSQTWIQDGFGRFVSGPVIETKKNEPLPVSPFWIRQSGSDAEVVS